MGQELSMHAKMLTPLTLTLTSECVYVSKYAFKFRKLIIAPISIEVHLLCSYWQDLCIDTKTFTSMILTLTPDLLQTGELCCPLETLVLCSQKRNFSCIRQKTKNYPIDHLCLYECKWRYKSERCLRWGLLGNFSFLSDPTEMFFLGIYKTLTHIVKVLARYNK